MISASIPISLIEIFLSFTSVVSVFFSCVIICDCGDVTTFVWTSSNCPSSAAFVSSIWFCNRSSEQLWNCKSIYLLREAGISSISDSLSYWPFMHGYSVKFYGETMCTSVIASKSFKWILLTFIFSDLAFLNLYLISSSFDFNISFLLFSSSKLNAYYNLAANMPS